ncbi:beta-glucosidase [Granulicella paludicola]|uniref:beta-glucosidase n=1 Tax=Granulicella paludicola TaxID=474951 RepID=UPI0021E0AFD7|nr:glycoside hydrolase family 3 C-terminal domain-containing protein [Granulicella paludicola]
MNVLRPASAFSLCMAALLTLQSPAQKPTAASVRPTEMNTSKPDIKKQPWLNPALDPDQRADLIVHEMTLDEKIQLVHGDGWGVLRVGAEVAPGHNGGAGFVPGIPRLGLPDINLADSAVGARMAARESRYATLLPSVIGMASSWDPEAARLYGSVIGRELRDQGYNMSIGGGMDLIREPRNGRNFEYASEDPILSGIMVGQLAMGVQDNHIMGDIKHYVLNDQETGRNTLNAILDKRSMQETDLLSFQIGIKMAKPAGVMCSYNRVNGDYACENNYTLNEVLKRDWGFKGFVLSDWEGTHSTEKAALAGLDMEQPGTNWFGEGLKKAVVEGRVPQTRLDDMVHRIVRSMFATGVVDEPPVRRVVDPFRGRDDAQHIEEESIVLLKNADNILPLAPGQIKSIAIIGDHADSGVLSGGGSAQVDAPGGRPGGSAWGTPVYFPSSPLKYVKEHAGATAEISFDAGTDPKAAAKLAKSAQVAIVFVTQWMSEGKDNATLSLPNNQDVLVANVAAANPNTIVVLETGGPVSMPWANNVKGIVETWYPGIGGAQAIANVLFGTVNATGKLPVTFAATESDLPHPQVPGLTADTRNNGMSGNAGRRQPHDFPVDYNVEGMMVGYKWFQAKDKQPLFPFGYGLSYTTYAYSGLKLDRAAKSATFAVKNTGTRDGVEIAQVYVTLPNAAGEPFRKLVGWKRLALAAGAEQTVTVDIDPLYLEIFDTEKNDWQRLAGDYRFEVGGSSAELPLHEAVTLSSR